MTAAPAPKRGESRLWALVTLVLGPGAGHAAFGAHGVAAVLYGVEVMLQLGSLGLALAGGALVTFVPWVAAFGLRAFLAVQLWRRSPAGGRAPGIPRGLVVVALFFLVGEGRRELARRMVVESYRMPSAEMAPTLAPGDVFFLSRLDRRARPGDVIAFRWPAHPETSYVKRVVAVAGDTVELDGEVLVVSGRDVPRRSRGAVPGAPRLEVVEERLGEHTYPVLADAERPSSSAPPRKVPAGHVFVLGDHRGTSVDSRQLGFVPLALVEGRPLAIYWSSGQGGLRRDRIGLVVR